MIILAVNIADKILAVNILAVNIVDKWSTYYSRALRQNYNAILQLTDKPFLYSTRQRQRERERERERERKRVSKERRVHH